MLLGYDFDIYYHNSINRKDYKQLFAVVGIDPAGEREVLGFTTGDHENEQAWTDLLEQFNQADTNRRARGAQGIRKVN